MLKIYGLKNCDSCRKALKWCREQDIITVFHDIRESVDAQNLDKWLVALGAKAVVNKKSTSWRNLSESQKQWSDKATLIRLLEEMPTLIKRPVIEVGDKIFIGFNSAIQQEIQEIQAQ